MIQWEENTSKSESLNGKNFGLRFACLWLCGIAPFPNKKWTKYGGQSRKNTF